MNEMEITTKVEKIVRCVYGAAVKQRGGAAPSL